MNHNIFNIDFNRLATWLVPKFRRKEKLMAFVRLLATPFIYTYNDFLTFKKAKLYQLKITPQKCYLERLLNDRYDFTQRRIYIENGKDKPPFYIFRRDEQKPKYIRRRSENLPKHIYTRGESGILQDDFVVFVPMDIVFAMAEMGSLISVYALAGIKFKIQRF